MPNGAIDKHVQTLKLSLSYLFSQTVLDSEITMNRLFLGLAVMAMSVALPATFAEAGWGHFGGGCYNNCGSCYNNCNTCCQPQTCCHTTYRRVSTCVPVTTYRKVCYRDHCGCCRTKCVPCTRYVRRSYCVPQTTCHTTYRSGCCNHCGHSYNHCGCHRGHSRGRLFSRRCCR